MWWDVKEGNREMMKEWESIKCNKFSICKVSKIRDKMSLRKEKQKKIKKSVDKVY